MIVLGDSGWFQGTPTKFLLRQCAATILLICVPLTKHRDKLKKVPFIAIYGIFRIALSILWKPLMQLWLARYPLSTWKICDCRWEK